MIFEPEEEQIEEAALSNVAPEGTKQAITATKKEESEIDLFSEFSKPTDKDLIKKEIASSASASSGSGLVMEEGEGNTTIANESATMNNHALIAQLTIAAVSVGLGMLLQFISGDWTETGEKRYILTPNRKKELLEPLSLMLESSKKKYNPVLILVITIIITYVPLFINAFRFKHDNIKEKQKLAYSGSEKTETKTEAKTETKEEKVETKKPEPEEVSVSDLNKVEKDIAERIKRIKSTRGKRKKEDSIFMEKFGL